MKNDDEKIVLSFDKKKLLKAVEIFIIILVLIVLIDVVCIFAIDRPLIAFSTNKDKNQTVYKGLLFNTYKCAETNDVKIKFKGTKYNCMISDDKLFKLSGIVTKIEDDYFILETDSSKKVKVSLENNPTLIGSDGIYLDQHISIELFEKLSKDTQKIIIDQINIIKDNKKDYSNIDFVIVYNGSDKNSGLEKIYSDGVYDYYLSGKSVSGAYVKFSNGDEVLLKEALWRKYIIPQQVIDKGFELVKEQASMTRGDFTIIDVANTCAEALELIYEDSTHEYYLSCQKSASVFIRFENGEMYTMKDALNQAYITPEKVIAKKYNLIKKKKNNRGDFKIIDEVEACGSAIEEVYRDEQFVYTLSCTKSGAVVVEFDNGEKYSLKEALNKKYITPEQVINKGYPLNKKPIARGDFKVVDNTGTCAQALEEIHNDGTYRYYLSCIKSASVFIEFDNGETYPIKDALYYGYVSVNQILDKGYSLIKKPIARGDFKIIDNVKNCASAIEEVYRDSKYIYTLSCVKSGAVIIEFDNGETYSLKDALNKKHVTPDQVIKKGYPLGKKPIARGDFKIIDNVENCASAIEEVYKDDKYIYTLSCMKSGAVIVEFDNGETYSLKDALNKKYVTPDQVIKKGYPLGKKPLFREDFTIIDESHLYSCAAVYEVVFENNKWICTSACGIDVLFTNGERYSVNEALKKGYVTPEQLKAKGYTRSCSLK